MVPNLSEIAATTIDNRSKKLADNVTKMTAFLAWLKESGNVKTVAGGSSIFQEFTFAENGNFAWYSGYDYLQVAAQEVISGASFPLRQAACPVIISGLEQLINSGREQMIDLLEGRIAAAEATMINNIAAAIYSDGTGYGGKQLTGLLSAVADDPTSGTYGGIDRAQWPFWRNQVLSAGKSFSTMTVAPNAGAAAEVQKFMTQLWIKCTRNADRPKLILADNEAYTAYITSLQILQRFAGTTEARLGFPTIKFMDADVVLDGGIGGFAPAQRMYYLNPKYLFYRPHKDRNMVPLSPNKRIPLNQDAEVQILAFAGNITCNGAQFQGILRGA